MAKLKLDVSPEFIATFWSRVHKTSACWFWIAAKTSKGYGHMSVQGKVVPAHRIAYALECGVIPDGLEVLHRCDTPSCVRPKHLRLGTHLENMRDAASKGRMGRFDSLVGANNPNARLSSEQVEIARRLIRDNGVSPQEIAILARVSAETIARLRRGDSWGLTRLRPRGGSILSFAKAQRIRKLQTHGFSQDAIAKRFQVSRGAVRGVLEGRTWI